jgi:hypothetical protein
MGDREQVFGLGVIILAIKVRLTGSLRAHPRNNPRHNGRHRLHVHRLLTMAAQFVRAAVA